MTSFKRLLDIYLDLLSLNLSKIVLNQSEKKVPYSVLCLSHQRTQVQSRVPKQGKRTDIAERFRVLQGPD